MSQRITYAVQRNVAATDKHGDPCFIAMVLVRFPDGKAHPIAIPEGLLATIPTDKVDDYIEHEVETLIGYEVTRQ